MMVVKPPGCRSHRSGIDGLLIREARFAQMDMHIDQAGQRRHLFAIDDFCFRRIDLFGDLQDAGLVKEDLLADQAVVFQYVHVFQQLHMLTSLKLNAHRPFDRGLADQHAVAHLFEDAALR